MASAYPRDMNAGKNTVGLVADKAMANDTIKRLGLSPRQMEMNRLYAYFRAQQHESCTMDWDGSEHADPLTREAISSTRSLPPGYQDLGGQMNSLPLRYRRPSVPCNLGKVIPSRFSSLLFSEQAHPIWKVVGDEDTEAWVTAVSKRYGLWALMALVRDLGGAMGTAIVGFKIIDGRVVFEEFDARWCFPTFDHRHPDELVRLEVRYMYPKDVRDPDTGEWEEKKFWYRRIIDQKVDCLWKPQPVGDGTDEPKWDDPNTVEDMREHGFGFVPIQWTQNIKVTGDIDGDPDCHGCYDYFDRIGELDSQVHKGAIRNCDPTPVVCSDGALNKVSLGSDQALKLARGDSATYLESMGASVAAASKEADRLRSKALETAECVLPEQESAEGGPITATELIRKTAAMYSKASRLRDQYGSRCLVPLMEKLLKVARKLRTTTKAADGGLVRQAIILPTRLVDKELAPIELGDAQGAQLELVWPPYSTPTPAETATKVTAAVQAKTGGILSAKSAIRHIAGDFDVEDVDAEEAAIKKATTPATKDLAGQSLGELNPPQ